MKQTSGQSGRGARRTGRGEEGILLVAVVFLLFLLVLSLTIALPKVRESIQVDRDRETMERGKQYIRAIQLYYRKFGSYPPSIDALVKTNDIRFLRKRYLDPTTGKDDWKPIRFGENKTPTAMGFFGQPLGGTTVAGTGPSGGNGVAGATTLGSPLGGPTSGAGATTGIGGAGIGGTGSSDTGTGQTFGGAGIIGVSPASPAKSILIYKKKDHYNQWEFTYDPLQDQKTMSGGNAGTIGQPASGLTGGAGGISPTSPTGPTSPTPPTGTTPQ
ncbi:MAG TPA: hypothetical protein VMV57_06985 [Terracidiphilus sp.]|nr:hypothetical protein [Terracidiphilus sp.]